LDKKKTWDFEGKVALVTGGSSGIGFALARLLVRQGAHVFLIARREALLQEAAELLRPVVSQNGQRIAFLSADVSSESEVSAAVDRVTEQMGLPDLVINSAGVTHPGYVQDLSLGIFRTMIEINYMGTVHVSKAVLNGMLKRGSGHIVNIASMAALVGVFGYTAYGASKFAVRGFTDALRAEVKHLGIDVSIVYPPDTDTPQLAYENQFKPPETRAISRLNSVLQPEKVAAEIMAGIAHRRYLLLPGFDSKLSYWLISVAGGLVYPVMDWLVAREKRKREVVDGYL
jgi:3-dehydrosphinganine reductase